MKNNYALWPPNLEFVNCTFEFKPRSNNIFLWAFHREWCNCEREVIDESGHNLKEDNGFLERVYN